MLRLRFIRLEIEMSQFWNFFDNKELKGLKSRDVKYHRGLNGNSTSHGWQAMPWHRLVEDGSAY